MKVNWKTRLGFATLAIIVGVALLLRSAPAPAQVPPPPVVGSLPAVVSVQRVSYQLVSQRRISRTVSDFTYRLTAQNSGLALLEVSGALSTTSRAITIRDNQVSFGDMASGAQRQSRDTFVLRQDRTQAFNVASLTWQFFAAPGEGVPADPGPAGMSTLAGIDANSNGVRDDIERYIAISFPSSERTRRGLNQFASGIQKALLSSTEAESDSAALEKFRGFLCLAVIGGNALHEPQRIVEALSVNTTARYKAWAAHEVRRSGSTGILPPRDKRKGACAFDPDALPN